jgi:hypothetical protein
VIWVIVISAAAVLVVIGVWLLLRDASPQPPGQHRGPGRARRRDPRDFPLTPDHEEPPTTGDLPG